MTRFIILLFTICLCGCYSHVYEVEPCEASILEEVSYSGHVSPIIGTTCAIADCHENDFEHGNFNKPEVVIEKAKSGMLEFMITTDQMPHGATEGPGYLTDCEIATIKKWIKDGAQNN